MQQGLGRGEHGKPIDEIEFYSTVKISPTIPGLVVGGKKPREVC